MTFRSAFVWLAATCSCLAAQPDLIIWGPTMNPKMVRQNYASNTCEVIEGCATPGPRRVLAFDTETRNIGDADLVIGDPAANPLFEYAACHGHYHFSEFADYRLVDTAGRLAATGFKAGFCLEDISRFGANARPIAMYTCDFQGISAGWADVYVSDLPCQWIDITTLPPGPYTLRIEVDPANRIPEANESNNVATAFVYIDPVCSAPPANDDFGAAQSLDGRVFTLMGSNGCGTREGGEPKHASLTGGGSVWYRWIPSYTGIAQITTQGSTLDTLLGVYRGNTLNSLVTLGANDDAVSRVRWSSVSVPVTNNAPVYIAVDGYNGQMGGVVLNVNPSGNDRFTNCLPIAGAAGAVAGVNFTATSEPAEPTHGPRSLWYCWTAPSNAPVRFHTHGSTIDTRLSVYRGTALSNLVLVAQNDDVSGLPTSSVVFDASEGVTYYAAVTGSDNGLVTLAWQPPVAPHFLSVVRSSNTVEFTLSGAVSDEYVIHSSSNLTAWSTSAYLTNTTGTVRFTNSTSTERQFYRALLVR
jgi:hypothetical protein